MGISDQTAAAAGTGAGAECAGAALLLARRYAANVSSAERNDVDRAVWAALDKIADARTSLTRMVRRADKLADADKRRWFGGTYAFKPVGTKVPTANLEAIIDRLGGTASPSVPKTTVKRYRLMFSHMECEDVSNPEWLGKDEPYTVFSLITQEEADAGGAARSVRTPVYKMNEKDLNRAPAQGSEQLPLFGVSGPAALDSDLLVTAAHFEHDLGDITDITKELTIILTAVAALAKAAKKDLVAIVLGALATAAGFLATVAADDPVGEPRSLLLTPADAEAKTPGTAAVALPVMRFNGGDANGIYRVFLTLQRF